jgi:hypothetical protein
MVSSLFYVLSFFLILYFIIYTGSRLMSVIKRYNDKQQAFWRRFTFPQEDRHLYTSAPWKTGEFRWFRSHNVLPFEWYRRSTPLETDQQVA